MKKIIAGLLAMLLVFSLFGCNSDATPTAPATREPTVPPTTVPPVTEAYTQAAAPLRDAENLKVELTTKKDVTALDGTFSILSEQELILTDIGADSFASSMQEEIEIGDQKNDLTEFFADDTLYVEMVGDVCFQGAMTAEEYTQRFAPAVLLDENLYADVTVEETSNGVTMTFAEPAAAESWALPEGATFLSASGSAKITGKGDLAKTVYSIEYIWGNTTVSMEVTSEAEIYDDDALEAPQNPYKYTEIEAIETPRLFTTAAMYLYACRTGSVTTYETVISQAAGAAVMSQVSQHYTGSEEDFMADSEYSTITYDSTGATKNLTWTESFRDGEFTATMDGESRTESGVDSKDLFEYMQELNINSFVPMKYVSSVKQENVNGVIYLEMELDSSFGDVLVSDICYLLFGDSKFLEAYATDYKTNTAVQYLTLDPYTGAPISAGYTYEGAHTIEGEQYTMSKEITQSYCLADTSTYTELTDTNAPEEEPAEKATPLLYKVTGADGQEMYLMGTIHVGDAKTAFMPEEVYEAFDACDALALEVNVMDYEEALENDPTLADQLAEHLYYTNGESTKDHLSEEVYEQAIKLLKISGDYNASIETVRPFVWSSCLDSFFLRFTNLRSEKGMDMRLQMMAKEQEKEVLEVESYLSNYQMHSGFSDALQEMELSAAFEVTIDEYREEVQHMYDLWCEGDEATLRAYLAEEGDEPMTAEEEALYAEYLDGMIIKRNEAMLEVAISYLESGDTVFYAVGLAHLLQENGLVDTLREAGYTVEQVIYN